MTCAYTAWRKKQLRFIYFTHGGVNNTAAIAVNMAAVVHSTKGTKSLRCREGCLQMERPRPLDGSANIAPHTPVANNRRTPCYAGAHPKIYASR